MPPALAPFQDADDTPATAEAIADLRRRVVALEAAVQHLHYRLHPAPLHVRLKRALFSPVTLARQARNLLGRTALTSRRAVWEDGRWRHRLDRGAFADTLAHQLFARRRPPSYDAAPFRPSSGAPRPRMLHVIANVAVGGSTQLMVDLMNGLGHLYEMSVLASAGPARPHRNMPLHLVPQPASAEEVRDLLGVLRPDLVHVHYWGDTDAAWYATAFAAAESLGLPVLQNVNTPVAPVRSAPIKATVYVSDYVRRTFGGEGLGEELVIHPGSDFARFTPSDEPDPHAGDSVGMVYRLERDKLSLKSIEPFIEIVRRRPRTRVFIIGGGSLFYPFVERVLAAGLLQNFVFTGYVPYETLPHWYAQFGVFVAPVWKESFGQVTPFAMSMGLAVTGARVGALPEILGGDAHLGDTAEEIADRTIALLDDPERRAAVGAANRRRALAHYGLDGMIESYAAVYGRMLPRTDLMPGYPPAEVFAT